MWIEKYCHTGKIHTVYISVTDGIYQQCAWWSVFDATENSSDDHPKTLVDTQRSDLNNSVSCTCSFDGAPSPSPPARASDWEQSGNRWRSRCRGHPGRSLPARPERCRSPGGREWRTSTAGDLTACHPSAADTGSICQMRRKRGGEEGVLAVKQTSPSQCKLQQVFSLVNPWQLVAFQG